jgi:hypothetical protein
MGLQDREYMRDEPIKPLPPIVPWRGRNSRSDKPKVSPEQWENLMKAMKNAGVKDKKKHWWELW